MTSNIKQTPEFKMLWNKYATYTGPDGIKLPRRGFNLTTFLSRWEHWWQYREWQIKEGLREPYDFGGDNQ